MITNIQDAVARLLTRTQGIYNLGFMKDLESAGWVIEQDVQLDETHHGQLYQFEIPSQAGLVGVNDICFGAAGEFGWVITVMEGDVDPESGMSYISPRPAYLAPYYSSKQYIEGGEFTLPDLEITFTELLLANRPVKLLLTLLDGLTYDYTAAVNRWEGIRTYLEGSISYVLGQGDERLVCIPSEGDMRYPGDASSNLDYRKES